VKVLHDAIAIRRGSVTTLHDKDPNTQTLIGAAQEPAPPPRRPRAAPVVADPHDDRSATAIG
jgi:hypothetical protein